MRVCRGGDQENDFVYNTARCVACLAGRPRLAGSPFSWSARPDRPMASARSVCCLNSPSSLWFSFLGFCFFVRVRGARVAPEDLNRTGKACRNYRNRRTRSPTRDDDGDDDGGD